MKIIFFGTPEYVLPILDALQKKFRANPNQSPIVAVVTQEPKPAGRTKKLAFPPVDAWAHKRGIKIFYNCQELLKANLTADLGILAAYGKLISKQVIIGFKYGILNIHPSLLPKFRGASPIQAAIITGEKETGVSIIKLDEKLDHGAIITQFKEDVSPLDTTQSLRERLFNRSTEVLTSLIPAYLKGKITPRKQEENEATFTRQITKQDAFLPSEFLFSDSQKSKRWEIPFIQNCSLTPTPHNLFNFIRAMQPWPIAWTQVAIKKQDLRLKILKAHLDKTDSNKEELILDLVQLEGKNPVSWKQFCQGYHQLWTKNLS